MFLPPLVGPAKSRNGENMKLTRLDIIVPLLAALSCLLMIPEIPVWALFIGWAWYYSMGKNLKVFSQATPPLMAGSLMAVLHFILYDGLAVIMPALSATMTGVFIPVSLLLRIQKTPSFSPTLPGFNAYSCIFIGYEAGTYLNVPGLPPLFNAWLWIAGANFIGLLFGWASIELEKRTAGRAA